MWTLPVYGLNIKICAHNLHFGFLYRRTNTDLATTVNNFDVADDFNVQNFSCLRQSSHITPESPYVELFALIINLSKLFKNQHIFHVLMGSSKILSTFFSLRTLKSIKWLYLHLSATRTTTPFPPHFRSHRFKALTDQPYDTILHTIILVGVNLTNFSSVSTKTYVSLITMHITQQKWWKI